ncbi:P27 family phage terminase small subunit [Halosquirtibacter xylanolyticus]|uniref:P27 family phage terminase small subunit n=1 Tax=Halosquirtibacter xylanolyticus TaxID=3374599 RepID=UPI0037485825|nr:P27 family phage terminase small subunit [Prolixibacteraceae bacterium]
MSLRKQEILQLFNELGIEVQKHEFHINRMVKRFSSYKRILKKANRYMVEDDMLIESLVMCEALRDRTYWKMVIEGETVFVDKNQTIKQKNHLASIYNDQIKHINLISKKLGLSPFDRNELKIEQEHDDGFND